MLHSSLRLHLGQLISSNANFKAYLTNPTISRGSKVDMVSKAFDAKSKTSAVTKNLLVTMAGNARLGDTEKVSANYQQAFAARMLVNRVCRGRSRFGLNIG